MKRSERSRWGLSQTSGKKSGVLELDFSQRFLLKSVLVLKSTVFRTLQSALALAETAGVAPHGFSRDC